MNLVLFLLGLVFGVVIFGAAAYRLGQKAAELIIKNKMW